MLPQACPVAPGGVLHAAVRMMDEPRCGTPARDGHVERGQREGLFRGAIDPVDLHMSISALAVFNVANRHTFALILQRDMESPAALIARRDSIIEMIVRFVRK